MSLGGRLRQGAGVLRHGGPRELASRAVRRAARALGTDSLEFPLLPGDVYDSVRAAQWQPPPAVERATAQRTIAWVMSPPAIGSGGHTTIFRMMAALERSGHHTVVLLYDRFGGDTGDHARRIRLGWPTIKADVLALADLNEPVDVAVATSWDSAHALASSSITTHARAYFVQDFEPWFHPRGAEYALAEDSYRFGFHILALGETVSEALSQIGVPSRKVPFGCDTTTYSLTNPGGARSGVSFYARPAAKRRGFELGVLALTEMHRRRPDIPVHAFGDSTDRLPFPHHNLGMLRPAELASLHNSTVAGLALSFTNISLLPDEMLACGCAPVLNDCHESRVGLPTGAGVFAAPNPSSLAKALIDLVDDPPAPSALAATARSGGWTPAEDMVVQELLNLVP